MVDCQKFHAAKLHYAKPTPTYTTSITALCNDGCPAISLHAARILSLAKIQRTPLSEYNDLAKDQCRGYLFTLNPRRTHTASLDFLSPGTIVTSISNHLRECVVLFTKDKPSSLSRIYWEGRMPKLHVQHKGRTDQRFSFADYILPSLSLYIHTNIKLQILDTLSSRSVS